MENPSSTGVVRFFILPQDLLIVIPFPCGGGLFDCLTASGYRFSIPMILLLSFDIIEASVGRVDLNPL
jgi:hypothetical protein